MTQYLGASQIARQLGVSTGTVTKWITRFAASGAPFPPPDVEIAETGGRVTRGWSPQRWPDIQQWAAADRYTTRRPGRPRGQHANSKLLNRHRDAPLPSSDNAAGG
ncbi:helix-turn-helix domain-containing protein [Kibdelosporangium philippinense]|uniref:helix-turn-helix domain-containing protein n=1 Tax=Kibdelosporangium philippinense TaxID=211113 RepID=UPI003558B08B